MKFIAVFFLTVFLFPLFSCLPTAGSSKTSKRETNSSPVSADVRLNYSNVKAMWLSQFDLADVYCDGAQRDKTEYTRLIENILDNLKSIGINTVIVQVRPNADSLYPSEYYPPSVYAVGAYGNDFSYDPFEIIVCEARKRELSVHAWINPMRAMKTDQIEAISNSYLIKKWWNDEISREKYLPTVNGRVYLNIAYTEVRQLITDGVREIVEKYGVDGLHMDDYFYPTTEKSFDAEAYEQFGEKTTVGEWRRNNLNTLVKEIYAAVKEENKSVLFGISPSGNIEKNFDTLYADVYTWCGETGYIDYICPQIHFGTEHETHAFSKTAEKWNKIIKTDSVKMWIGMTLGKAADGSDGIADKWAGTGKDEWINNNDVLLKCLNYTKNADKCVGVAYFSYQYFFAPLTGEENIKTKTERDNFLPVFKDIEWND